MLLFDSDVQTMILSFSSNSYLPCTVTLLFTAHSYRMRFLKVQVIVIVIQISAVPNLLNLLAVRVLHRAVQYYPPEHNPIFL